jgi:hypothetical protein
MMLGSSADVVAHTNPEAFSFLRPGPCKELIFEPAKKFMEENLLHIYKDKLKCCHRN